eukprot:3946849-Heterocapsa_arctica.AAC.1
MPVTALPGVLLVPQEVFIIPSDDENEEKKTEKAEHDDLAVRLAIELEAKKADRSPRGTDSGAATPPPGK